MHIASKNAEADRHWIVGVAEEVRFEMDAERSNGMIVHCELLDEALSRTWVRLHQSLDAKGGANERGSKETRRDTPICLYLSYLASLLLSVWMKSGLLQNMSLSLAYDFYRISVYRYLFICTMHLPKLVLLTVTVNNKSFGNLAKVLATTCKIAPFSLNWYRQLCITFAWHSVIVANSRQFDR